MNKYEYQVGGSLKMHAPSYVERQADSELYNALLRGEFCYVFSSRQMGKSSLRLRTRHRLQQAGFSCASIDMTRIGSENITPSQWYKGLVVDLLRGFNLFGKVNLKTWWHEREDISALQRLSQFVEDILLVQLKSKKIFIFIDEIDSVLGLNFPVEDFFALIRYCYNQRAENPEYHRLTWALFGVATPSDLIADRKRTPFNIGKSIDLHGFQLSEVQPLAAGLEGKVANPMAVFKEILAWTGGQPFLTQKLCQIVVQERNSGSRGVQEPGSLEAEDRYKLDYHLPIINYHLINFYYQFPSLILEKLVQTHIIENWEANDEPEHLKTIRDRLLRNEQRAGGLLELYQQILQGFEVSLDGSQEQIELLLSGLVVKQQGQLRVKNRIYQEVFNSVWVEKQLAKLRPYSQALDAWVASERRDPSRLLRGQALLEAQAWSHDKSLSDLDYQFLGASVEFDRREVETILEAERTKEVEARLVQEQKAARLQRLFLGAISLALVVASGLGMTTFFQYRKTLLGEIKAIATSSEALFASNKRLDALIQAIRAKQRLQNLGVADADNQTQVESVLRQAVYGVKEYNRLSGHSAGVNGIAISPDGKMIASGSEDKTVKLWKIDGTSLATLSGHSNDVEGVVFSPDGKMIASASDDKTVKLWKIDGTSLATLSGHSDEVEGVVFSPNGKMIASVSEDKTVKLWKIDGTLLTTLFEHSNEVQGVVFSPDGKMIASVSEDKTVKLWKPEGTLMTTISGHSAGLNSVAISPDGKIIASASKDKTVKIWKPDGTLLTTLSGHSDKVEGVVFSPDGKMIASASADKTVKLWKLDDALLTTLSGYSDEFKGVVFSSDGKMIASASADKTVKLWKPDGTSMTILSGHSDAVNSVAISPDNKMIASTSADKTVKLWKPDGTLMTTLSGYSDVVNSVAISPDNKMIASAGDDKTVKLWQPDGTSLATLSGHSTGVNSVALSPDSKMIASASDDKTVKLWKIDGTLLTTLFGHSDEVEGVVFSPDGRMIASASADKTVKLWQPDGTLMITLSGHSAGVNSVTISPDGKIIASASADKTVKLWKTDGTLLTTLSGHSDAVEEVAISPDGKMIASASDDKTVILWDLDRVLDLDKLLVYGCDWVRDYLKTNPDVSESDRHLCDGLRY